MLWRKMFFLSCDQGLKIVTVYYYQIWDKKEHKLFIISRFISSHIDLRYIETLSIDELLRRIHKCIQTNKMYTYCFNEQQFKKRVQNGKKAYLMN